MEQELKNIARKDVMKELKIYSIIEVGFFILTLFFSLFSATKRLSLSFFGMLCLGIIMFPLSTIKRLILIKNTHFIYGMIKNVEDGQYISLNVEIEYVDENTNKICTIERNLYYGEEIDLTEEEIKEIYQTGQELVGNKIPLLYKKNKPNKTIAFFEEKNNTYAIIWN